MKFTLSWLKDHLDTNASIEQICERLTAIGLEVESITDPAQALKSFTVAKILEAKKHPEADKLQVCCVQSDVGELQIVCGAPNARAGLHVALAKEGAVIPHGGMVIKKTKIRGVESNGMLCSAEELDLEIPGDGIIELPLDSKIGEPVAHVLGLADPVIDVAITPNRADALSVYGIARDLAAAGLGTLKPLAVPTIAGTFPSPIKVSLATPNCPQFIGCTIRGVKNGESPDWLKKRLVAIGKRPISALVDVTNYLTFDLGRPLHVFDAKKLRGNIVARDAKPGEKLLALDGKEYALPAGAVAIADDSGAVGLGGIIGGEATSCDENTTDVFLEVALFNPMQIAKTGRELQIDSDARYRFERGIDPAFVEAGAKIALQLIHTLCGGEVSELVVAGSAPEWKRSITLRFARIAALSGLAIPDAVHVKNILSALGFACLDEKDGLLVVPPSWRADIEGEADVIEELLRIHGYDHIPTTPLPKLAALGKPALTVSQKRAHLARRALATNGFLECCTWSFLPQTQAKLFGGGDEKLKLLNPISADLDAMRPSLLPNLLTAMEKNAARGFYDLSLFEVGLQFSDIGEQGQHLVATGIRAGFAHDYDYKDQPLKQRAQSYNIFNAKADALAVLNALGVNIGGLTITTNAPAWYHPGRSGVFTLGGRIILGYFGEIHPAIGNNYGIIELLTGFAAFEILLDAIPTPRDKSKTRPPLKLSNFQIVHRDFAFTVDEKISAAEILKTLGQADKQLITHIELFDVYAGKGVDAGKKSVAVRVTLQSMERTMSEQDITTISNAIVEAAKKFGGSLRQ